MLHWFALHWVRIAISLVLLAIIVWLVIKAIRKRNSDRKYEMTARMFERKEKGLQNDLKKEYRAYDKAVRNEGLALDAIAKDYEEAVALAVVDDNVDDSPADKRCY